VADARALLEPVGDVPFCYLTTTGRVSGRAHRIEIWFAIDRATTVPTIYLLAGARERSDWVANLVADPHCTVEIGEHTFDATGRVLEGTGEERAARDLVYAKYREGNDLEVWRESALPVALDLTAG
jgi:deazaflavin-dependent oxidoreductase (nitroreductase family)